MRILHRIARQERERKGPGLNGDPPMPADQDAARDDGFSGLSPADLELLEVAAAKVPLLGPAARSRGRHLADAERSLHGDDALRQLLGHLHWMERVHGQGVFPATWGQHICAVLAACHELHTGGGTPEPPPLSDGHADRLLRIVKEGGPL